MYDSVFERRKTPQNRQNANFNNFCDKTIYKPKNLCYNNRVPYNFEYGGVAKR